MAQTGKLDLPLVSLPPVPPVFTGLVGEGAGWTALGVAGVERGQHTYTTMYSYCERTDSSVECACVRVFYG